MSRAEFFRDLARSLPEPRGDDNVIIGVDGIDGAGKTRFALDLSRHLEGERPVVAVSIDGFHHVRERRYRRGRTSPEGFWLDSYDYDGFRRDVVEPFRAGFGTYLPAAHDVDSDRVLDAPRLPVPRGVTLIVDGIFLQREELADVWDATIFLDVPFEVSVARMARRDGGSADSDAPSNARYVEGQRLYLEQCRPAESATVLIDYRDLLKPVIVRAASSIEEER